MLKWKIGDITVTQLVEIVDASGELDFLPAATPTRLLEIPWLRPHFITETGRLIYNIQMLIIETPSSKIVVDTCVGNEKNITIEGWGNLQLPFLEDLRTLGHDPESIDTVICTHLHVDHVGWNTRKVDGRWIPTFPNARYTFTRTEFDHWQAIGEHFGDVFNESVVPVFEAGLVDLVAVNHDVGEGVSFQPTPGHTPGHICVRIESRGESAIITGDMIHHPCQITHPEWVAPFDDDNDAAVATRKSFVEQYADSGTLVLGTHFADPVGGHIVRDGDAFRFEIK